MDLNFSHISLSQAQLYYQFWSQTPQHSIDYTLANLWGWQPYFGLEWANNDQLLFIKQTKFADTFWAPLGNWNSIDWNKTFDMLYTTCQNFIRVPEDLVTIWQSKVPERIEVIEERGQWEYIYNQNDLANLPGQKYHKKKNHYANYVKTYGEPDYHEINNMVVEDVLALQDQWCQWHECSHSPSLEAENEAINQVLSHWDKFNDLFGGALYLDKQIVAFSIGEKLSSTTIGVHYEKGLTGYKGIYQTINKEFSSRAAANFAYINRAQDLNEEGLRLAKTSYHPTSYLKKYTCILKG